MRAFVKHLAVPYGPALFQPFLPPASTLSSKSIDVCCSPGFPDDARVKRLGHSRPAAIATAPPDLPSRFTLLHAAFAKPPSLQSYSARSRDIPLHLFQAQEVRNAASGTESAGSSRCPFSRPLRRGFPALLHRHIARRRRLDCGLQSASLVFAKARQTPHDAHMAHICGARHPCFRRFRTCCP